MYSIIDCLNIYTRFVFLGAMLASSILCNAAVTWKRYPVAKCQEMNCDSIYLSNRSVLCTSDSGVYVSQGKPVEQDICVTAEMATGILYSPNDIIHKVGMNGVLAFVGDSLVRSLFVSTMEFLGPEYSSWYHEIVNMSTTWEGAPREKIDHTYLCSPRLGPYNITIAFFWRIQVGVGLVSRLPWARGHLNCVWWENGNAMRHCDGSHASGAKERWQGEDILDTIQLKGKPRRQFIVISSGAVHSTPSCRGFIGEDDYIQKSGHIQGSMEQMINFKKDWIITDSEHGNARNIFFLPLLLKEGYRQSAIPSEACANATNTAIRRYVSDPLRNQSIASCRDGYEVIDTINVTGRYGSYVEPGTVGDGIHYDRIVDYVLLQLIAERLIKYNSSNWRQSSSWDLSRSFGSNLCPGEVEPIDPQPEPKLSPGVSPVAAVGPLPEVSQVPAAPVPVGAMRKNSTKTDIDMDNKTFIGQRSYLPKDEVYPIYVFPTENQNRAKYDWELPLLPPASRVQSLNMVKANPPDGKFIPKNIFIAVREVGPDKLPSHSEIFFKNNPDWNVTIHGNVEKDLFMETYFANTSVLWAYRLLNPNIGCAKPEIWRLAVLYLFGGMYIDDDAYIDAKLDTLVGINDKFIVSHEGEGAAVSDECYYESFELSLTAMDKTYGPTNHSAIYTGNKFLNWALFSSPKHPLVIRTLIRIVQLIFGEYISRPLIKPFKHDPGKLLMCASTYPLVYAAHELYLEKKYSSEELGIRVCDSHFREYGGNMKQWFNDFRGDHWVKVMRRHTEYLVQWDNLPLELRDGELIQPVNTNDIYVIYKSSRYRLQSAEDVAILGCHVSRIRMMPLAKVEAIRLAGTIPSQPNVERWGMLCRTNNPYVHYL